MVDTVLEMELASVIDDTIPDRVGVFKRYKKYTFFLGRFGPFVERVPLENTDPTEFQRRVETLRTQLRLQQQH
jgi:hypothetical protein